MEKITGKTGGLRYFAFNLDRKFDQVRLLLMGTVRWETPTKDIFTKIRIEHFLQIHFAFLFLTAHTLLAQSSNDLKLQEPKRFIDKVEVFAGPSLSFNYGNKFVENYNDENVSNERLLKPGYAFGIGVYHSISNRFDLNVRLQYEQKGTNSELNTPTLKINSEYTYKYLTIGLTPQTYFGHNRNLALAIGGYYSILQDVEGVVDVLDKDNQITYHSNFAGREIRELRSDGSVSSITFSPGLQSFNKSDFGLVIKLSYLINLSSVSQLSTQLGFSTGFQNINKSTDIAINPPEKNQTIIFTLCYLYNRPK